MNNTAPLSCCFRMERFISFPLSDPGGVLFFGQLFFLCHEAFEQFILKELCESWNDWFQNEEWVVPIRHTEANFTRPLLAGKKCRIDLAIINVSETGFSVSYSFFQDELCCHALITHVFCDRVACKKIPIPESIKNKLLSLLI